MSVEEHIQTILKIAEEYRDSAFEKVSAEESVEEQIDILNCAYNRYSEYLEKIDELVEKMTEIKKSIHKMSDKKTKDMRKHGIYLKSHCNERTCLILNKYAINEQKLFTIVAMESLAQTGLKKLQSDSEHFSAPIAYINRVYNGPDHLKNTQESYLHLEYRNGVYILTGREFHFKLSVYIISKECAEKLLLDIIETGEKISAENNIYSEKNLKAT